MGWDGASLALLKLFNDNGRVCGRAEDSTTIWRRSKLSALVQLLPPGCRIQLICCMLIAGVEGFKILHLPARRMRSYDQLFGKLLVKDQTMGYSDSVEDTTASTSELDPQYEIEMQERGGAYAHQVTSSDPHDEVMLIGKHSWTFFRRRGLKVLAAVASLILLVLLVSIPIQKRKQREQDLTNVSSDTPMGPPSDNSTAVPNPMDASGSLDDELLDEVNLTRVVFAPLSTLDPVVDLGILGVDRPVQSRPSSRMDPLKTDNVKQALPTNAWYQNLLLLRDDQSPTNQNRAYTMPYVVDVTGGIPGLRLHDSFVDTSADQVIVSTIEAEAVTLGAARNFSDVGSSKPSSDQGYSVEAATDLGITLQWVRTCMT